MEINNLIPTIIFSSITGISVAVNLTQQLIISSINKTFNITKNLFTYKNLNINGIIKNNDLLLKLKIIESFIKEINVDNETVKIIIQSISETINEINNILLNVEQKIINHNKKYFSRFRSINFNNDFYLLQEKINILNIRYQFLIDMKKLLNN